MVEKIGTIRNPLTIIAIFAGIAEITGTVVLPLISETNQATYIWFLIIFPTSLIGLFFLTLNFNHKVLYAPSDFKHEDNFFKSFSKASPQQQELKIKDELKEAVGNVGIAANMQEQTELQGSEQSEAARNVDKNNQNTKSQNADGINKGDESEDTAVMFSRSAPIHPSDKDEFRKQYVLSRDLVLQKLEDEYSIIYKNQLLAGTNFIFDALIDTSNKIIGVEVKFVPDSSNPFAVGRRAIDGYMLTLQGVQTLYREKLTYRLILVMEHKPKVSIGNLKWNLKRHASKNDLECEIEVFTIDDLILKANLGVD